MNYIQAKTAAYSGRICWRYSNFTLLKYFLELTIACIHVVDQRVVYDGRINCQSYCVADIGQL